MKKQMYWWGGGIILFLIVLASLFSTSSQTTNTQTHIESQERLSFSIPETWSGHYETSYTPQGDIIFYFKAPEGSIPLFVIHKREDTVVPGASYISEQHGMIYSVTVTEEGIYQGEEKRFFKNMQEEVDDVIPSISFF